MKPQECNESAMIDQIIGKDISWMKFEPNGIDCQTISFGLTFCRFVEEFGDFEISILGFLDVILSTECLFSGVCTLWLCFEASLSFISYCKVKLNCFWQKEWMIGDIQSISLINMNDKTDYHSFFSAFF
jgi:hypothetical protein